MLAINISLSEDVLRVLQYLVLESSGVSFSKDDNKNQKNHVDVLGDRHNLMLVVAGPAGSNDLETRK